MTGTDFGPAPINQPCPDCGVYPVDGYMSHLTTCPQRVLERASFADPPPPAQGFEVEPEDVPGWLANLIDWVRWQFSKIDPLELKIVFWMLVIGGIFIWLALGEGASDINKWIEGK